MTSYCQPLERAFCKLQLKCVRIKIFEIDMGNYFKNYERICCLKNVLNILIRDFFGWNDIDIKYNEGI